MPPRRRAAAASAAATAKAPTQRASKLAKQHGINAAQETEIKEAFALFEDADSTPKHPFMPTASVRRALAAMNLSPSSDELQELLDAADPENEGIVSYEAFLGVAALRMSMQEDDDEDDEGQGGEDEDMLDAYEDEDEELVAATKGKKKGKAKDKGKGRAAKDQTDEIEHAFKLFIGGQGTAQDVITFAHLKRVAKDLKEDVSDDMLKDMMREASGGTRGVSLEEFEGIMRRAGVFR